MIKRKTKEELGAELTERVLAKYPETRASDIELHLRAWEEQGFILNYYQNAAFRRLFSTETIRRSRQDLQHQGKYWPDENTRRYRALKAAQMREKYSKAKIESKNKEYTFDEKTQTYYLHNHATALW